MPLYRIQLEPLSPIYEGRYGRAHKSGAIVHSDTLHAALVDVAALMGGEALETAKEFRLSSIFPFHGSSFFLPRPFLPLPGGDTEDDDPKQRKRWKNIQYVSEATMAEWLKDTPDFKEKVDVFGGKFLHIQGGKFNAKEPAYAKDKRPGVAVDRITNATAIYQRHGLHINAAKGWGLYFLANVPAENHNILMQLCEVLGGQGIGGERSVGYGRFELLSVDTLDNHALYTASGAAFIALSLYYPTETEVKNGALEKPAAYDCAIRGGWIHNIAGSQHRKRSVRMCIEGSCIALPNAQSAGDIVYLQPKKFTDHEIWRSGYALGIPFTPKNNGGTP